VIVEAGDAGDVFTVDRFLGGVDLRPVEAGDVLNRLDGKRLHAAGIFGDQQNIQPVARGAARDGGEIDNRDDLIANVHHPHQRRLNSGGAGEARHRDNFAQLKDVDAVQLRGVAL
jgi:hypothetical protein